MAANDEIYDETEDIPAGRKARTISPVLWNTLAEAAKRGVGFSRTAPAEVIDTLRKDLTSAAVKAKYEVTTATAVLEDGRHKLTFAAKRKTAPVPPAPAAEAPASPAPAKASK